jgi:hypothetical protein
MKGGSGAFNADPCVLPCVIYFSGPEKKLRRFSSFIPYHHPYHPSALRISSFEMFLVFRIVCSRPSDRATEPHKRRSIIIPKDGTKECFTFLGGDRAAYLEFKGDEMQGVYDDGEKSNVSNLAAAECFGSCQLKLCGCFVAAWRPQDLRGFRSYGNIRMYYSWWDLFWGCFRGFFGGIGRLVGGSSGVVGCMTLVLQFCGEDNAT